MFYTSEPIGTALRMYRHHQTEPSMFPLTHLGRVTHWASIYHSIVGSDGGLSPDRPGLYLNHSWLITGAFMNELQWILNLNTTLFTQIILMQWHIKCRLQIGTQLFSAPVCFNWLLLTLPGHISWCLNSFIASSVRELIGHGGVITRKAFLIAGPLWGESTGLWWFSS